MPSWNRWDVALLAIAMYMAVIALVRLMRSRREQLMAEFKQQLDKEHRRQANKSGAAQADDRAA